MRAARSAASRGPVLIEHHRSKESGHPAQVVGLADAGMIAREPVQLASIPVLPERFRLLGRCQPIAEAGDDEPAIFGDLRRVIQW